MNHPRRPLEAELRALRADGLDFVDLTLEPPGAWPIEPARARALLEELGLAAVGHTAFYLPIASPFPELRQAARDIFTQALDAFAGAGVELVNVHPDATPRLDPLEEVVARNAEAIASLAADARERGIRLMVENVGGRFATAAALRPILAATPDLGFHLDVAHAHLGGGRLPELLEAFGARVAHVHVSDNRGGPDDLHEPLGAGVVDWPDAVTRLKAVGYDGKVTLEVFSTEREHLRTSARLWRGWWST